MTLAAAFFFPVIWITSPVSRFIFFMSSGSILAIPLPKSLWDASATRRVKTFVFWVCFVM